MKQLFCLFVAIGALVGFAAEPKRDPAVVSSYIRACVGDITIRKIAGHEGGAAFLKSFFADQDWMEQFAGSGSWSNDPWKNVDAGKGELYENNEFAAKALEALDLLVWNDDGDFIKTRIGRNIATALALNHGRDWDDDKLVQVMDCYRQWTRDGSLHKDAWKHDVRKWREVLGFGQNAGLPVEDLRWIHDFANVPSGEYYGMCWKCAYRLFNCFGASVHGPQYYQPWAHRWQTQELRYRVGGVCGALSKFGSHCAAAHGVRSFTAGQPGHCAYMLWDDAVGRWGTAYSVTGHTNPHNSLGGMGFSAIEEQERFFSHPNRMRSEYLRWKGDYAGSLKACPGNWNAAVSWFNQLKGDKGTTDEAWIKLADAICESFAEAPSQGWQLLHPVLGRITPKQQLAVAERALRTIRESPADTYEAPYWDDLTLNPLAARLKKLDPEAEWKIFEAALDGQAKTKTFYRKTINWGAERLMNSAANTQRYLDVIGANAAKSGEKLDFRTMVLGATKDQDVEKFRMVYNLMDKIAADQRPAPNQRKWKTERFGGQLLSPDGMLIISSTSRWDNPTFYRDALTPVGYNAGNAFHTNGESAPWGMVKLPGKSKIKGVTVVNAGHSGNERRQVPLKIWVSEDGKNFKEIHSATEVAPEWSCQLDIPVEAQYVKVGREPGASGDVFHLYKILVYGDKLY